ncbi:MAG: heparinase II/III family protein [Candidatus Latescibacterota bacterium]
MSAVQVLWAPRLIQCGRTFRLAVGSSGPDVELDGGGCAERARRWSAADGVLFVYLQAPQASGSCLLRARCGDQEAQVPVDVCSLQELRQPFTFGAFAWPRRWPVGRQTGSVKERQTLQEMPVQAPSSQAVAWWLAQDDATVWCQLPPAEMPRAHFVNVHQGCPQCGTAIFAHGGFYPWRRSHLPADWRSTCPSCGAVFPSNDLAAGDFTSGPHVDDGYGYFDAEGHVFLFAATYTRDQVRTFGGAIGLLANQLRADGFDEAAARRLGLMLLRYAAEEVYLAAVPQFRYGPTEGEEKPWRWGQPDWGAEPDAVAAFYRHGSLRYCIDIPYISETLGIAYDTLWPFLRQDVELVERARALGLDLAGPSEAVGLVEEMLAGLLQCHLDGGASSNLPRVSEGALTLVRALDRADAQDVLEWLYDRGPDRLRVFATNDFFPDGTPPEATGGYNSIHTDGLFSLEHHLLQLRALHPQAYPEARFPSLLADPRAPRVAVAPAEITMIGRTYFQFGDGSAPGCGAQLGTPRGEDAASIRLEKPLFHAPMTSHTLERAARFTGEAAVGRVLEAVRQGRHLELGCTVHDGVGIAVLRTPGAPERAAAGIVYGDTTGHRHMDLLDVQLCACERPFLMDLGYPQSWASIGPWEGQWATHNAAWGIVPGLDSGRIAGRGRLVRLLESEGVRLLEVEAERWAWDASQGWYRPGVSFRRLLALVDTDGDGVALVDLCRIRGGAEHWRVCRGLEGTFWAQTEARPQPGTVAGEGIQRGQLGALPHPDYAPLAYMDDVRVLSAGAFWQGTWESHREPGVYLQVRQLGASPGTRVLEARATAAMGRPEESPYTFRTLLWRRRPADAAEATCVDLLFEPHPGRPTVAWARAIPASRPEATGVEVRTASERLIRLYWSPGVGPEELTRFEDSTQLWGPLAVVTDRGVAAQGVSRLEAGNRTCVFDHAVQTGTVTAANRQERVVIVEGLQQVQAGERLIVNPAGRGHTYRIEEVSRQPDGRWRLRLDVTGLLGRARVGQVAGTRVELEHWVMTRTGNLHGTRLQREADGSWGRITAAHNPDLGRTVVQLQTPLAVQPGDWVSVVDYGVGEEVRLEGTRRA